MTSAVDAVRGGAVRGGLSLVVSALTQPSRRDPGNSGAPRDRRGAVRMAGRWAVLSRSADGIPRVAVPFMAVLWAVVLGLALAALLARVTAPTADGLASVIWLAAQQAPIHSDSGPVTLLPIGLGVIALLPLRRAGRFLVAQTPGHLLRRVGLFAAALYAGVAAVIAAGTPSFTVITAGLWALGFALAGGGWGVLRETRGRLPLPGPVRGVLVAMTVPLALGTVLVVAALVAGRESVLMVQQELAPTAVEQVGLTLLQLGYLPNLIVWGGAFAVGSGISLGTDQVLSPFSDSRAVVPDLPMFAALPTDPPNWTALLPIGVVAGAALAAVIMARHRPEPRLGHRVGRAAGLAAGVWLSWLGLSVLAGGSLGDGRLEYLGPAAGTALLAAVLAGAGGLLWALLPTLASDAKPVAVDLRARVAATRAKEPAGSRE